MFRIISFLAASAAALICTGVQAAPPAIAADAPDSYTVVKGDTLWGISARFLQEPWRWPEVWRMSKNQARDPHLIYPGQVIVLDRRGPYLQIGKVVSGGTAKGSGIEPMGDARLQPKIYQTPVDEAVSTIPLKSIAPFLIRPLVVETSSIDGAATIVATETNRVYLAQGDTVFARDVRADVDKWAIFRPGKLLADPVGGKRFGYEVQYLGSARVTERTDPVTLEIVEAVEEIGTGDLMLPTEDDLVFSYAPHAPGEIVDAKLISIYRGVAETGKLNVVALSAGKLGGLEPGHVLALFRDRGTAVYKGESAGVAKAHALPEKRYGSVLVFRVFDNVSYALIMNTDGQAAIGDAARNP
ncbi:MAG: LysM peptidoglycan-binding domain-containing protein [Azoarcus sp.]|jgi:ribosomal protein L27|nr:LysM peptidoglycan-binding domain-containing protein [Azoarcus sp.]